jgi:hypothetical protein
MGPEKALLSFLRECGSILYASVHMALLDVADFLSGRPKDRARHVFHFPFQRKLLLEKIYIYSAS